MNENLIIFKKTYEFMKWLFNHTINFPKSHRFSVAVRIENAILDFLEQILLANHRRDKLPLLRKADEIWMLLRIYIRISHDLKFLSTSSYRYAIQNLQEIGKLLGGWIKSQLPGVKK